MRRVHGIRGAITVENNEREEILQATKELLQEIMARNNLNVEDIISAIFSVTTDLDAVFPAVGARDIGWDRVPMLSVNEIPVPGSLPRCIRVLLHVESSLERKDIQPVYLREAVNLRPDLFDLIITLA